VARLASVIFFTNNGDIVAKTRPVNLNIPSLKFPITAIVSILHRLSGFVLFLFIPVVLWVFGYSLTSAAHFHNLALAMSNVWFRLGVWIFFSGLIYHLFAGIRHLFMDLHWGESLRGGRIGAWFILAVSVVLIVLLAVYILIGLDHVVY